MLLIAVQCLMGMEAARAQPFLSLDLVGRANGRIEVVATGPAHEGPSQLPLASATDPFEIIWDSQGKRETLRLTDYEIGNMTIGGLLRGAQQTLPPQAVSSYSMRLEAVSSGGAHFVIFLQIDKNLVQTVAAFLSVNGSQGGRVQVFNYAYSSPHAIGFRQPYLGATSIVPTHGVAAPSLAVAATPVAPPVTPKLRRTSWDVTRPFAYLTSPPHGFGMNQQVFDAITAARDQYLREVSRLLRHPESEIVPKGAILVSIEPLFAVGRNPGPAEGAEGFRVTFWVSQDFLDRGKLRQRPEAVVQAFKPDGAVWSECESLLLP